MFNGELKAAKVGKTGKLTEQTVTLMTYLTGKQQKVAE